MDPFDIFGSLFASGLSTPHGRTTTPSERWAAGLVGGVFPLLAFAIVLFGGLWDNTTALIAVPALFSFAGYFVCRALSTRTSFVIATALGGTLMNFVTAGCAFLLGAFLGFWQQF